MYKEKSAEYYNRHAGVYDSDVKHSRRPESTHDPLLEIMRTIKCSAVLDVGSGTGTLLDRLTENPRVMLAGTDISIEMCRTARKKLGDKAGLLAGDSEMLPWKDDAFDLVTSTYSFHHYPNPGKVMSEMKRVLKPGGHLIITDCWSPLPLRVFWNVTSPFNTDGDFHVYSRREICKLMESQGFELKKWELVNRHAFILLACNHKQKRVTGCKEGDSSKIRE